MKIIVIYDNNVNKNEYISDIIGDKGFGDIVVKKQKIENQIKNIISSFFKDITWQRIDSLADYIKFMNNFKDYGDDIRVFHFFSNYFIKDKEKVFLSFEKFFYIDKGYKIFFENKISGLIFPNLTSYLPYYKNILSGQTIEEASDYIKNSFEIEGYSDLSNINNFIGCLTNNVDLRFFNSLSEDDYTITKTSTDKLKIKKEYNFYYFLPDDMKYWFVMPFNYFENDQMAGYTMERLYMTDLAIKYVHRSINKEEFNSLMNKYFYFFKMRHSRPCSEEKYKAKAVELYKTKVNERTDKLKQCPQFKTVERLIESGNITIDGLKERYFYLKQTIEEKNNYPNVEVIGHGDPGFANALYNKSTQTLKFIDPKGALDESELWTNPYYDIAKLSHCIIGKYDFFNNGLFEIKINENLSYELDIPFNNKEFTEIFKSKLIENGFDYLTVRIYEASLFLSMLPLHIDNPYKVFGFILNLKNILDEIEKELNESK